MNEIKVEPGVGVGSYRFGGNRSVIERSSDAEFSVFHRTREADGPTLACDQLGIHLEFDAANRLKGVSVFRPQRAMLGDVLLTARPVMDVVYDLQSLGFRPEKVDVGFWLAEQGLLLIEVEGDVDGISLSALRDGNTTL